MELNDKHSRSPRIEAELEVRIQSITEVELPGPVKTPDNDLRRSLQSEPPGTPVMYQTWSDLLFLHWAWDARELQAMLPPWPFC